MREGLVLNWMIPILSAPKYNEFNKRNWGRFTEEFEQFSIRGRELTNVNVFLTDHCIKNSVCHLE